MRRMMSSVVALLEVCRVIEVAVLGMVATVVCRLILVVASLVVCVD